MKPFFIRQQLACPKHRGSTPSIAFSVPTPTFPASCRRCLKTKMPQDEDASRRRCLKTKMPQDRTLNMVVRSAKQDTVPQRDKADTVPKRSAAEDFRFPVWLSRRSSSKLSIFQNEHLGPMSIMDRWRAVRCAGSRVELGRCNRGSPQRPLHCRLLDVAAEAPVDELIAGRLSVRRRLEHPSNHSGRRTSYHTLPLGFAGGNPPWP